jgi:hypothetical protein
VVTQEETMLADVLLADGPDPRHADALMLFGRFVGEWELDWTGYGPDGEQTMTERGEWIFGWVLEGRAVQDVWIIPERARRDPAVPPEGEYGTTIRVYDPRRAVWLVTWNGPLNRARRTFVGRRVGDTIVQEGQTDEGDPMQWIFSDITESSFSWRSISSKDGETWQLREEMRVRRKPA